MTDLALLGEVARLPQLGGPVSVEVLASGPATHFHLLRTRRGHGAAGVMTPGEEAEAQARLLSAAPVMLDLLSVLLLRWGDGQRRSGGVARDVRRRPCGAPGDRRPAYAKDGAVKRGLSIAEPIRQDVLDLHPEPPRPPCPIPPRLLILACSATKAAGEGLVARERYQGPLWQTLRAADPDGSRTFVCFLSAKFGLGDARDVLPCYDRVLTDADADRIVSANAWECYPELPQNGRMTMAAKLRAANRDGPRHSPSGVLTRLVRELGQPFRDVAICGGHRYVRVASSWLPDVRVRRQLAADAPVTSAKPEVCAGINGPTGVMRVRLRAWMAR